MPKRATHTFESEKDGVNEPQLGVQYCMCCGESVLILGPEVSLTDLPRRKTDGAIVLERGVTVFKLKSKPTETKVLKRPGGYERQYRFGCWNCGVQLGYRAEDGGDSVALTYLLADATGAQADLYLQMFQVPQCIQSTGPSSVRVALDVLVGQSKRLLRSIETDAVAVSVAAPAREGLANAELVDFMQKVLAVPRSQLQLSRGWSAASKFLMVTGVPAVQVFKRIKAAIEVDAPTGGAALPAEQPNDFVLTAGAAASTARRGWEAAEELEELAEAPAKNQQTFIK